MSGPIEVDEKYVGGSDSNRHIDKKGTSPKAPVGGCEGPGHRPCVGCPGPRDHPSPVGGFRGAAHGGTGHEVYTDGNPAYRILKNHESVNYSAGEYVRGKAHTNGIESFWALLERGYDGIFHHISRKHLHRYVNEFAGRLNIRDMDTADMMVIQVRGMVGRRLTYKALIA